MTSPDIPNAPESELELLAALLARGSMVLARTELKSAQFYDPRVRESWAAAEAVWRAGGEVDASTVAAELQARGRLDAVGGYGWLTTDRVGLLDTLPHHAGLVRKAHSQRQLILQLGDLQRRAFEADPAELAALAQARIAEAVEDRKDPTRSLYATATAVLEAKSEEVRARREGREVVPRLKTGFEEVDEILGGLVDESLNFLGGGTSHGKSAIARGFCMFLAEVGIPSQVFTTEDPDEAIAERSLADYGQVELHTLASMPERLDLPSWGRLAEARERLRFADRILLDDSAGMSIERIAMRVRKHRPRHKTRLVVIDYLQKLIDPRVRQGAPGWRKDNVDLALAGATRLAREEGICVLMLSQLNRESAREGRPPEMFDFRESGEIEQQARTIMAIYRPEKDARDAAGKAEQAGRATLRILKNFRGRTGDAELMFDGPTATFHSPRAMSAAANQGRGGWR